MLNKQENKNLDHLGIHELASIKRRLLNLLVAKKTDGIVGKILKKIINMFLFIPRVFIRNKRRKSFVNFYKKHNNDVEKLLSLVGDDISRDVIKTQIDFLTNYNNTTELGYLKKGGLLEKHNLLLNKDEYFPEGVINLSENEGFVDCGAYIGDTLVEFIKRSNGKFNHAFCFEASPKIFLDLEATARNLGLESSKISCYSKGVWSKNETLNFSFNGIGSAVCDNGEEKISVVKLDDFLSEQEKGKITFIKMDIEGAEIDALRGMSEIIKNNKPKLAVCVYHKPEHFWEIPFLIKSLSPDYKIYFRQHAISRLETVCYAV